MAAFAGESAYISDDSGPFHLVGAGELAGPSQMPLRRSPGGRSSPDEPRAAPGYLRWIKFEWLDYGDGARPSVLRARCRRPSRGRTWSVLVLPLSSPGRTHGVRQNANKVIVSSVLLVYDHLLLSLVVIGGRTSV